MKNYLISYEFRSPYHNRELFISEIQKTLISCQISHNLWYVKSSLTSVQIAQYLEQYLDLDDVLFVTEMKECGWNKGLSIDTQRFIQSHWSA